MHKFCDSSMNPQEFSGYLGQSRVDVGKLEVGAGSNGVIGFHDRRAIGTSVIYHQIETKATGSWVRIVLVSERGNVRQYRRRGEPELHFAEIVVSIVL